MCRNIKRLHNIDPPATDAEMRDAALQFVRKISGYRKPSQANADAFERCVDDVTAAVNVMLASLTTSAPARDRAADAAAAQRRAAKRYSV